ncbi:MAG: DUF4102 domain-containing protein [Gammaproteobacteria bacterium]|nr:DUF4102 domain-containing protein [Gammaproteobacteria bacterium]
MHKPYKLYDGDGLCIVVHPNGSRYWRMKYQYAGKEKTLAVGVYPDMKIIAAREQVKDAHALLKQGIDPVNARRVKKAKNLEHSLDTFELVAKEWLSKNTGEWSPAIPTKLKHYCPAMSFLELENIPSEQLPHVCNDCK